MAYRESRNVDGSTKRSYERECKRKERGKKKHRRRHKKAKREKKAASARNVSCHCVKYQEGGKKEGWTGGERKEVAERAERKEAI